MKELLLKSIDWVTHVQPENIEQAKWARKKIEESSEDDLQADFLYVSEADDEATIFNMVVNKYDRI